jgi:CBS-domain-containing membrane protein
VKVYYCESNPGESVLEPGWTVILWIMPAAGFLSALIGVLLAVLFDREMRRMVPNHTSLDTSQTRRTRR